MASLALRNLVHDKVRLAVTLVGVIFAVVLVAVQTGLFIGFQTATSDVIDNSKADLWVTSKGVGYVEVGVPFSERKLYQALGTPGVAAAEKYIVQLTGWKRNDGEEARVEVIGFNPDAGLGGPWNVVEGNPGAVKQADAVIIDRLYQQKLGVTHIGQICEIAGHRARVVGFTEGIRTFTTSPTVFTSFKNALNYARLDDDRTMYLLIKVAPGENIEVVRRRLRARLSDMDVWTTAEFSRRTRNYWLFSTGAGVTVMIAAVLGLIVGIVVVAQTIYAATVDHIREYGTLKAMGATNRYIYGVIIKQAVTSAVVGYVVGMIIAVIAELSSRNGGAAIILPLGVRVGLFGLTLIMCVSAALVSVNKITKIDPAMVFRQ